MTELERLIAGYEIAKELGYHKNEFWQSIHRSILRLQGELNASRKSHCRLCHS